MKANEERASAAQLLKEPYARLVVPQDDGTFRAEILEFPGCIALGATPAAALEILENAAESWLEAALEKKRPIPAPTEETEFSGKLVLRLPKSLHKRATYAAQRDGVSLNQFILTAVATHIGLDAVAAHKTAQYGNYMIVTNITNMNWSTNVAVANIGAEWSIFSASISTAVLPSASVLNQTAATDQRATVIDRRMAIYARD